MRVSFVLFFASAAALQLPTAPTARPHVRVPPPRLQFGGKPKGDPPTGLTRDNEPDDYFKSDFENMSDAEKIKQPGVIVGLAILIVPFIVGAIALQVYR